MTPEELHTLLEDLSGLTDEGVAQRAETLFTELFLGSDTVGVHPAHDGQPVYFWKDRFSHAFFTSGDWCRRPYSKEAIDRDRVARIRWIKPILAGAVVGTGCWEIREPGERRGPKRLYALIVEAYIIWLEPRRKGGWVFSSAYVAGYGQVRRYCSQGRKIW